MASWYIDAGASGTNVGTSEANAWTSLNAASKGLLYSSYADGDIIWVRRNTTYTPAAVALAVADSGAYSAPLYLIGVPRAAVSITSATWTVGSLTVSSIVGPTISERAHVARYITAPDGYDYLIGKAVSGTEILLDRPYCGASVSGGSGAASIKADDSPISYPGGSWGSDASHNVPLIDQGTSGGYYMAFHEKPNWVFQHLKFQGSSVAVGTGGAVSLSAAYGVHSAFRFKGCIFQMSENTQAINLKYGGYGTGFFLDIERCVAYGDSDGGGQSLVGTSETPPFCGVVYKIKDAVIYNMGGIGIKSFYNNAFLENVRFGYSGELNDGGDIACAGSQIFGRDVLLSATTPIATLGGSPLISGVTLENKDYTLGKHWAYYRLGVVESVIAGATGEANQRAGGSEILIKITPNGSSTLLPITPWAREIFSMEYEMIGSEQKTWRYYVQAIGALTATELWLELEYVKNCTTTTRYTIVKIISDEAISARSTGDEDDWDQYLEIPNVLPAVDSKVRVKCYVSYYSATNTIWIDPQVSWT